MYFNMKVCCVFSLESPHRGDSNEYTQHTISQYEKEISPKLSQICSSMIFQGTQERGQNSRGCKLSVFEPLKFYCIGSKDKSLLSLKRF